MKYNIKSSNANRGMTLEADINESNTYYLKNNIALIYKKPTPLTITKVSYNNRMPRINEAFFTMPSTLDYNGVYNGYYLDFDAKETKSTTSFPLSNIHEHQLQHIKRVIEHKGISFLIVRFISLNQTYLLLGSDLLEFISSNERRSIPIEYFVKHAYTIDLKYSPRIDYIKVINKLLEEK